MGTNSEEYMTLEDVAAVLLGSAASSWRLPGGCIEHLTLRSPSPVTGTPPPGILATGATDA
jgi:hypothetical protein